MWSRLRLNTPPSLYDDRQSLGYEQRNARSARATDPLVQRDHQRMGAVAIQTMTKEEAQAKHIMDSVHLARELEDALILAQRVDVDMNSIPAFKSTMERISLMLGIAEKISVLLRPKR
jgi:hypothetical protein